MAERERESGESGGRVFVTGSGVLSGSSDSPGSLWELACSGSKSRGEIPGNGGLAARVGLASGDASILARHQLLALNVVESAWSLAGLGKERNRLRGEGTKHRHSRFGCIGGSSLGGLVAMESDLEETRGAKLSPYAISRWRGNSVSAAVSLRHGLGGSVLSLNAASATGAQILWMAGSMIRGGMADLVVAVAADPYPSELVGKALGRNGSVAKDAASTPLSPARSGMIPAEGAACLILESASHLAKRGAVPLAEWLGGGCLNESYHLQAPDPDGSTLENLIRDVLGEFSSIPDWISLHATGTPRYDSVEAQVIQRLFGERMPWVSAFKGITGHALSASGLLEAALLVEGLKRGAVTPLPKRVDKSLGLSLPDGKKPPVPKTALQIAQGMGGDVVVNLLGTAAVQQ